MTLIQQIFGRSWRGACLHTGRPAAVAALLSLAATLVAAASSVDTVGPGTPALVSTTATTAAPVAPALPAGPRRRALASGRTPTAEALLDWAETNYQQFFPGHKSTQSAAPYVYRFYPETGNYVGVAGSQAYILGPISNGAVQAVGALSDFTCQVSPRDCVVPRVQRIAADGDVTAFVLPDGRIGLLGEEAYPVRYTGLLPGSVIKLVDGVTNAVSVRVPIGLGTHKVVYLTADGDVYGWGDGRKSLGQRSGSPDKVTTPVKLGQLSGVVDVSLADANMTMALKSDGTVWTLPGIELDNGVIAASRVPGLPRIKSIAPFTAGDLSHQPTLAVDETGQVWTIRRAASVRDSANNRTLYPVTVERMLFAPAGVQQIACEGLGERSTCLALVDDGSLKAWGENNARFGDGTRADSTLPVAVRFPASERVRQISMAGDCSLALAESGRLYFWGCDYITGNFVTATSAPLVPTGLYSGIDEFAVWESRRIVSVSTTGQVYSWGGVVSGSLGDGRTRDSDTPVRVIGLTMD